MRRKFRAGVERLSEQNKTIINRYQHESHADADVGLAPVHANAQRDAHQGKTETGEGKGYLPMNLKTNRRSQIVSLLFQLVLSGPQLFRRQSPERERGIDALLQIMQFIPELRKGHVPDSGAGSA